MSPQPHSSDLIPLVELAVAQAKIKSATGENLRTWITEPEFAAYLADIAAAIRAGQWTELEAAFWEKIEFGTGGRRGPMGKYGSATINTRTIAESAFGMADYFRQKTGRTTGRAVIAHDSRNRSREFAELTASVFAAQGMQVFLFEAIRATPELSFAVLHLKCDLGVMISASHNPPADNGFKAYWSHGGQVTSPHDKGIVACVYAAKDIPIADFAAAVKRGQIEIIGESVDAIFIAELLQLSLSSQRKLKAIYSPLHGVGETSVYRMLKATGFDGVSIFEPHREPNGNFPNVPKQLPNPESPQVFEPIIPQADAEGISLIVASDPDADRIAVMVRETATGKFVALTGNQQGALIADYIIRKRQLAQVRPGQDNRFTGPLTAENYVVTTLVTTQLTPAIARAASVQAVDDLLVGFKYIGETMDARGVDHFLFGTEESLGYLAGDYARDKDAAIAALYLCELAAELASEGRTLLDQLDGLYAQHGYYAERQRNDYAYGPTGKALIKSLMHAFRTTPPLELGGVTLTRVADYGTHEIRQLPSNSKTADLAQPQGDLVMFFGEHADCRIRFAVRPSGTEPKIKFYLFAEPHGPAGTSVADHKARTDARLEALVQALGRWVEPHITAK